LERITAALERDQMRLGWILASIVLLALLAAPAHAAADEVVDGFSVVNESNSVEWNNKGVALSRQGNYNEALICFDKALELDPEFAYALNGKGNALYKLGNYDEALICFEKALELDPKFVNAWNGKGGALYKLGNYDEALICFEKALELDPKYVHALNGKGNTLNELGKYGEALICFEKALEIDPKFVHALNGKGNTLAGLGKYDEALICFEKALELDPKFVNAWNGKGGALYKLGNYGEALICFEKALELDPKYVHALNGKGNTLNELGKYGEALICFEKALEIDPKFVHALNGKGNTLVGLGKYDEALICFEKALELDPEFAYALNGKGVALQTLNQTEEAIEHYNKALQLDSKIPGFWYNKGNALESLNHFAEAAMAYSLGREREMNLETKTGIFAAFLVIYSALAVGGYVLSRRFQKYTMSIFILSINLLGLLAIMWVLSGFFDLLLVGQFLVGGVLMVAISAVLWFLSGLPTNPWMAQMVLEIEDFKRKCPRLSWTIRAVGLLAVLAYALIATVFYFRFHLITELSMVHFLKIASLSIFFVGLFVTLPPILAAMLSKNLDWRTRDFLLIFQFGHLGVSALYLGLILWIFGIGSFAHTVPLGNIKFPISPHFLGFMMSLFLLAIIGPYISGSKRASRWNVTLLEKERAWLDELLDVLEYPTPGRYVPKLQKILDGIKDDDTIFGQDEELDRIESLYGAEVLRLDLRFCYRDFLTRLRDRIGENIAQFGELEGDKDAIKETARIYAEAYRLRRDEIVEVIEREERFKPKFWIALAIILTPIVNGGLKLSNYGGLKLSSST